MAPRRRKSAAADGGDVAETSAMEKIARLLAVVATKDMDTDDAALKLDAIGFDAQEIAMVLGVGSNFVNVARHRSKTKKGRAKKARD